MDDPNLNYEWVDRGYEPQCSADPRFPRGVRMDLSNGAPVYCETNLPWPARRCGYYLVNCSLCKLSAVVTTAGRLDDPNYVRVACKGVS